MTPPQTPPRAGGRPLFALLRRGPFRALFVAHLASNLGDWLAFLALFGVAALEQQASPARLALLGIAWVMPLVLVAPLAGLLVDRWELRRVLVACDALRALLLVAMAATGRLEVLAVLLFAHQSVSCFFNPAQQAALPRLVAHHELLAANALTNGAGNLAKLLGPLVAGGLVATLGTRGCFLADAVSFAASGVLLATLPKLPPEARPAGDPLARWKLELRAGFAHLVRSRTLRAPLLLVLWSMAILGGFLGIFAAYARDRLVAGTSGMGLLLSTLGAGAVAGALAVGRYGDRLARIHCIGCGLLLLALALALLALPIGFGVALAAMALLGAGSAAILVAAHALVQEETPRPLLGRASSTAVAAIGLAQAAATALAGALAGALGLGRLLGAAAALLGLGVLVALLARPPAARAPRAAPDV